MAERRATASRSRTACHSGASGGMTTTIESQAERVAPVQDVVELSRGLLRRFQRRIERQSRQRRTHAMLADHDQRHVLAMTDAVPARQRIDAERRRSRARSGPASGRGSKAGRPDSPATVRPRSTPSAASSSPTRDRSGPEKPRGVRRQVEDRRLQADRWSGRCR